jgi:copper(I)-binding protein
MQKLTLEIVVALALTIAAILASATGVSASDIVVREAFARASATPSAQAGAAYVTLTNMASEPVRILSAASPAAQSAEMHRMVMNGEVMHMEPAGAVDLPPHETLTMAPGGLHVMLTGLKAPLRQGDTIELVLMLEKGGPISVEVPVGGIAAGSGTE